MYKFLRKVPLFSDLPDEDLERLCEMIDEVHLAAGEELFAEGSAGHHAYIIQEGQLEIIKSSGGREVLLAVRREGEVIGEMSLVEEAPRMASVRARTNSILLSISQEQFENLLHSSSSAARALLFTVLARWRATEAMLRQSEKMAQLGTLTAGLAHELNNPAAAVQRGAEQLQKVEDQTQEASMTLERMGLTSEQLDTLEKMQNLARQRAQVPDDLDALTQADREEALEDWLDDQDIDEAWEFAPPLVKMGLGPDELGDLLGQFPGEQFTILVRLLDGVYSLFSLMEEVHQGAARISEIVKSLKTYAYLDQAPVQEVDVHEGLDNTLVLLRNKLKQGVSVRREYAEGLPHIQAYGSELNQVWTNIIDNAADAMNGKGELVIRTRQEGQWVVVELLDNGPGIPENIREKIFDPFFTTKPVGVGTGLGLDISWNIVANKHRGDIKVHSQPGWTCFEVWLPINFEEVGTLPSTGGTGQRWDDETLNLILDETKTIAVVGISNRTSRPAHSVPAYLQRNGYHIFPVTPNYPEILGEETYPDLAKIPDPVDTVLIFRPSELVGPVVEQAIEIGAKTVWMQEGIVNESAAAIAKDAGLNVVMDTCMRTTHRRLKR